MPSLPHDCNPPDEVLVRIAEYVCQPPAFSDEAYATARFCLMDSLGCALLGLNFPACEKLIGPVVPGAMLPGGARVPGTTLELDPVQAAFCIGTLIRWLDFNDAFLAAEWGHPSDNLGAILATADWQGRDAARSGATVGSSSRATATSNNALTVRDILTAMIQAHEIQGVLSLENALNRVGLDHVLFVRIASVAVATHMLGGSEQQIRDALSNAWLDGGALRAYRHAPNTGSRKSWATGDATSRAVRLALWMMAGEMGYRTALTAPTWGFQDSLFRGQAIRLGQPLRSYVMENVLFKVAWPAEFHGQTAVEAAVQLYPQVKDRWDQISRIVIETQESALRIISKRGPLTNPADRDHCLQYMVAVALLRGTLRAEDYDDKAAADPQIDWLRERMEAVERADYSRDYLDPQKRSIANAVEVFFADGSHTAHVEVQYPLGHRRRRHEARPALVEKFLRNARTRLGDEKARSLAALFEDEQRLDATPVTELIGATLPKA